MGLGNHLRPRPFQEFAHSLVGQLEIASQRQLFGHPVCHQKTLLGLHQVGHRPPFFEVLRTLLVWPGIGSSDDVQRSFKQRTQAHVGACQQRHQIFQPGPERGESGRTFLAESEAAVGDFVQQLARRVLSVHKKPWFVPCDPQQSWLKLLQNATYRWQQPGILRHAGQHQGHHLTGQGLQRGACFWRSGCVHSLRIRLGTPALAGFGRRWQVGGREIDHGHRSGWWWRRYLSR